MIVERLVEVTLWLPPGCDVLVHVDGEVERMMDDVHDVAKQLYSLALSLWERRR